MLTAGEKDYLSKIPVNKRVSIKPYTNSLHKTAFQIIKSVKTVCPDLNIVHMGASALSISGQGDIDIYGLANPNNFDQYFSPIKQVLGEPVDKKVDSITWKLIKNNHKTEFYLTDPNSSAMKRQIAVFEILQNSPDLLEEYRELKESLDGKLLKEYQTKKYEFYHRILEDRFE